jgi:peroxiredoxin
LELHHEALKNSGLQVIAVAQGEPKHIDRYCGKLAPHITCLAREDTSAYTDYGLTRMGLKEITHPGNVSAGIRILKGGYRPGEVIGDVAMMPGTFIVDTGGIIRFAYYSEHAGDHPRFEDLLKAAEQLKAQR